MGFFDFLFTSSEERKRIFISFAIEDEKYRDYLVSQARNTKSPFDFIDMSVKDPYPQKEWKVKCRTKIKRCHGVIVLVSNYTIRSSGARWEIKCAKEEGLKIFPMYVNKNNKGALPPELLGKRVYYWKWQNISKFINKL